MTLLPRKFILTLPLTYSRRKRQADTTASDVYSYDQIPDKLRRQITMIIKEAVGGYYDGHDYGYKACVFYDGVVALIRKEKGVYNLVRGYTESPEKELFTWIEQEEVLDDLLDGLEFAIRSIDGWVRKQGHDAKPYVDITPDTAIAEFNARVSEAGVGYSYNAQKILKVDSQLVHREAMLPMLTLISHSKYATVNDEYRRAHDAYRHRDYETTLTECAKAFESTLKIIATEHQWPFNPNDTAQKLIDACVANGLFASFLPQGFNGLRSMLESGIPTIRNKTAAHGAGSTPRIIPEHLATLQIYQTAVVIRFLIEASDAYQPSA